MSSAGRIDVIWDEKKIKAHTTKKANLIIIIFFTKKHTMKNNMFHEKVKSNMRSGLVRTNLEREVNMGIRKKGEKRINSGKNNGKEELVFN